MQETNSNIKRRLFVGALKDLDIVSGHWVSLHYFKRHHDLLSLTQIVKSISIVKRPLAKSFSILILLCFLIVASNTCGAEAQYSDMSTVLGLLQECKISDPSTPQDLARWTGCRDYILGIRDALGLNGDLRMQDGVKAIGICNLPENLPVDAYVRVFINWAEKHPEEYGKHRFSAISALMEKWPCP